MHLQMMIVINYKNIISLVFVFLTFGTSFSQWLPDIRLTNNGAQSEVDSRCIGAYGNMVHVVWNDERDNNREIYYKNSTDGGYTWGQDTRLTVEPYDSFDPYIFVSESIVHIIWTNGQDGTYEIYYKRSTDNGTSWSPDIQISHDPGISFGGAISVWNSLVTIVWHDNRDGNHEIYFNRSIDGGVTWGIDKRLTFNPADSFEPYITLNQQTINLIWIDRRNGFDGEVYFKRSSDAGVSWSEDSNFTNDLATSGALSISSSGTNVFLVWQDDRYGLNSNNEIFFKQSSNAGISWGNDVRLTAHPSSSTYPCIVSSGNIVHIVWTDNRNGRDDIFYKRSTDSGLSWSSEIPIVNDTNYSNSPSVAVSNYFVHVLWRDERDNNSEIYYKHNPTGNIEPPGSAPTLISPVNNSINIPLTPFLNWDSIPNVTTFRTQVSLDNNFSVILFDSNTINSNINIPTNILSSNNQYFWRVCGSNNGSNGPWSNIWNFHTAVSLISQPHSFDKWISGEVDTIKWSGISWPLINLKVLANIGSTQQHEYTIAENVSSTSENYVWSIPEFLLSFRSKIIIENAQNLNQRIEGNTFRIKPYILTKINPDSTYYEYRKYRDQWGFWNETKQMWPESWYQQFNYSGIDPFTGLQYSSTQGWFTFPLANSKQFPDWVSFVRAFTVEGCYLDLQKPIYSPLALTKWKAIKRDFGGSCFGIAISNALVFKNRHEFYDKYPNFSQFKNPIDVTINDEARRTVNELYTYQFGQPHINYANAYGLQKTVNQTLREIQQMLLNDEEPLKTLSLRNNTPNSESGHAVVAYQVKQDMEHKNIFYIYIYDNAVPESKIPIKIDTLGNGGTGIWEYPIFPDWGGSKKFFLRDPATEYLANPIFDRSSLLLHDSILQINSRVSSLIIKDTEGNITGHTSDSLYTNIPQSFTMTLENIQESLPYGYSLKNDYYFITAKHFTTDTNQIYFFSGNKAYIYERTDARPSQTDILKTNNGLSILNIDTSLKNVNVSSISKENEGEKLIVLHSLSINLNDSLKFTQIDSNRYKLFSFGELDFYNILLNYASQNGLEQFGASNIPLQPNSSHIYLPNWENLTSPLTILVDLENNSTIDDTLSIINEIVNIEHEGFFIPKNYNLAQNYPNPFNSTTIINFDIVSHENVRLAIYDITGREIIVLVNKPLNVGRYKVAWNAANIPSGVYFYKIETKNFHLSKKMVLTK